MTQNSEHAAPRILVIDDEPGICLAVSLLLEQQYAVVSEMTAEAGLARAREPFALILLDLLMPGVNEYDLLKGIQQNAAQTPIVVLSAMGDKRTHDEVLRHGASGLIEKPFTRQELLLGVENVLSRRFRQ